ncbi:type IV secretory system conjugative DNA transfer family protein [Rhodococcus opacus]|uniref:TraM recognition domain-containing protein n=1 Tax=Rhodococcus opacus TaxID=37919 RepID=A0AAX3YPS0_RHOOP|nr:TraM recognition domain-containing protein [Rhodococcus opacus]WLF51507.1 TraM recognition domain-containing protein [Rhodococcus opacus]
MSDRGVKDPVNSAREVYLIAAVVAVVGVVGGGVMLALRLGTDQEVPANPAVVLIDLVKGHLQWSTTATVLITVYAVVVLAAAFVILVLVARSRGKRTRVDNKAKHMGRLRDVGSLTEKQCRKESDRLGVVLEEGAAPGVPIGKHLLSGQNLYAKYEDMHVDIWGPRSGKSSSRVIPAILEAPGAVLTTSNKRDVVDATRDPREAKGGKVWIFDPQKVADGENTWWWDPLSWVTDEVRAADLAAHFAAGDDGLDAKKDSFFDPEGQDLLTALFLAAAAEQKPITQVYTWVTDETNVEPVNILRKHGYDLHASGLSGQYNAPAKQRGGVFGTARKMIRCLKMQSIRPWVSTDGQRSRVPHFDPREFVRSNDTIYLLSREGNGSAGPLVTALTVAICEAAEELATRSKGGRLPVPLLAALDESANVVRWTQLPKLYSHYGSRGIVIMAILQSYAQGTEVWGNKGMGMLHSAANVKVYGGGCEVAVDDNYLRSLSTAIGEHWEYSGSVSSGRGGRSTSRQRTKITTFTESELEELPRGRAIVRSSGNRATLVKTVPWWEGPYAEQVRASIARHDPEADKTLAEAVTLTDDAEPKEVQPV